MRRNIVGLLLLCIATVGWTAEYKIFWRCSDKHLEALDFHSSNDKKVNLFLNYFNQNSQELHSSPISLKSFAELPPNLNQDSFLMLSDGNYIFMNCVGRVTLLPHDIQGKVVFDASKNAYSCPFVPKDCSGA
ncbi:hypothetical protein [Legionella hackeliae]|uniref:Uncharacterized protein n=1 Tax=Legionella hackeliae TaxID=449 RepID=A0A0A8UQR5_LEGHA|nr:hypothetical protein [Legionella hackeliae]KTD09615.1 hypothetical protein Lhac_1983 [Legionella hackeliae]CEK11068.1 exported protein of unknown function [Legionella hackeliae]STX47815.1 Uncharacterised protein [Legionella hackeliae]